VFARESKEVARNENVKIVFCAYLHEKDQFTSILNQNDPWPILHIIQYISPAEMSHFCTICLSVVSHTADVFVHSTLEHGRKFIFFLVYVIFFNPTTFYHLPIVLRLLVNQVLWVLYDIDFLWARICV